MDSRALLSIVSIALGLASWFGESTRPNSIAQIPDDGCLVCHAGIEEMHPKDKLSCVDCHGGNASARTKAEAHVAPKRAAAGDERVAPLDEDLAWRRFVDPMDLRVVDATCGTCHAKEVARVHTSLHATTAGHLSDGFYEMGLAKEKTSQYGVFAVKKDPARKGEIAELAQVPPFQASASKRDLASHYADLSRKECMQCHLWSNGRAVRGRVGFDGDYRGEGCAACHVPYALDGLSESADRTTPKNEPGHPRVHQLTRAPTTQACSACHFGDAAIGLDYRGLAQLPPGAPAGPQVPGTTAAPLNRVFYLDDPSLCPPDIHHETGMHCIDCHTTNDVMGDGELHGAMEKAVEITCSACHGTFDAPATMRTERGTPLENLRRDGERVLLKGKVDGAEHEVTQIVHVLDPRSADFNPTAAKAMTAEHAKLECYACHSSWNPNFLGFHFDRNESLTQLDLESGKRTPGRVTTQEKVFTTWKSFFAGFDERGKIAPYLTGFSTMGTVHDEKGATIVDQALPVTAAGLSGMTMIHHQTHTNRPTARSCVECHRASATWGLGSANFKLGRQLAFVAVRRGVEVVALNRSQLSSSVPLARIVVPDVVALALRCDPLQGEARVLFAAEAGRGIRAIDVSNPIAPKTVGFAACSDPRDLALFGDELLCADGDGGLIVFDAHDPSKLSRVAAVATFDAQKLAVQWPFVYVADGAGGLAIVDLHQSRKPVFAGGLHVHQDPATPDDIVDVAVLFQYSRPEADAERVLDRRTKARLLCAVIDRREGFSLVDVTEAARPSLLYPKAARLGRSRVAKNTTWKGLEMRSHVDLAELQGGTRTRERDYVYLLRQFDDGKQKVGALMVFDVSDPLTPRFAGETVPGGLDHELAFGSYYNPPFLESKAFVAGENGVALVDLNLSTQPKVQGDLAGLRGTRAIALEEFPLDRMLDESGRVEKDVSHRDSRWMNLGEIAHVLGVDGAKIGAYDPKSPAIDAPGATARLFLSQWDLDGSGALEGVEIDNAKAKSMDQNGDGRVTFAELAGAANERVGDAPTSTLRPMNAASGVALDSAIAKLVDGLDPTLFDANKDGKLDRDEFARALFAALDLDGDGTLSPGELSRRDGAPRELRFGGEAARAAFKSFDANDDGKIEPREFKLAQTEFDALDVSHDGSIRLREDAAMKNGERYIEWPHRQAESTGLPPTITVERLLEVFDADHDGLLSQRELKARPDLFREFDANADRKIESKELAERVARALNYGVDACADDFVKRWDLNGDGKVDERELPASAQIARITVHRK